MLLGSFRKRFKDFWVWEYWLGSGSFKRASNGLRRKFQGDSDGMKGFHVVFSEILGSFIEFHRVSEGIPRGFRGLQGVFRSVSKSWLWEKLRKIHRVWTVFSQASGSIRGFHQNFCGFLKSFWEFKGFSDDCRIQGNSENFTIQKVLWEFRRLQAVFRGMSWVSESSVGFIRIIEGFRRLSGS